MFKVGDRVMRIYHPHPYGVESGTMGTIVEYNTSSPYVKWDTGGYTHSYKERLQYVPTTNQAAKQFLDKEW